MMGATVPACAASEPAQQAQKIKPKSAAGTPEHIMSNVRLPPNQRFATLDEFLLYLRTVEAPADGAWYREIEPGVYRLETGNRRRIINLPDARAEEKTVFTRQELLEKFGFSR